MKRSFLFALAITALALAPGMPASAEKVAPEWIFETPRPDSRNTYFVGASSDESGDVAAAANDAAANLVAAITQYIGVALSSTTSATARATLDSYSADIRTTLTGSATNQVAGFAVRERYVQREEKSKRVTVYLLAAYVTADLEREKARILQGWRDIADSVAKPEAEGRSLEAEGRYYDAVRKYVEAAVAASRGQVDNADIKVERNINSARAILSKLRFDASASSGYGGLAGQAFPRPFSARLLAGEGDEAAGVPGAAVLLSYQRKSGARLVSKTESLATDASGAISFAPPPPEFVGKAKFGLKLDFRSTLDLLDALPEKYAPFRDSLEDEVRAMYLEVPYEVSSSARAVPMALALVDLDENGSPVDGSRAQAGLLEALLREKFTVRGISVGDAALRAMDDAAVLRAAAAAGSFERVAFGFASIGGVRRDGTSYLASGKATVKVLEIATGSVLCQVERSTTGVGDDEKSARAAAYRELGRSAVGSELLSGLR